MNILCKCVCMCARMWCHQMWAPVRIRIVEPAQMERWWDVWSQKLMEINLVEATRTWIIMNSGSSGWSGCVMMRGKVGFTRVPGNHDRIQDQDLFPHLGTSATQHRPRWARVLGQSLHQAPLELPLASGPAAEEGIAGANNDVPCISRTGHR